MTLELPWPPSVNHYWRHITKGPMAGRVLISKKGREYRAAVIRLIAGLPHIPTMKGRLMVAMTAYVPDLRGRDLDNIPKAIFDALTHAGVYADDRQIDRLWIERGAVTKGGKVVLTITQLTQ